jgi:ADP-ribose pyrophosphatase
MQPWKTLSRQVVLRRGKFLAVEDHTVELPGGEVIEPWPWVVTPDFVNVVVVTEAGEFLMFRQIKYAIGHESIATVGGYIEPGEAPQDAARRELREETGYESDRWIDLGRYVVDCNRGAGTAHFYLALDAHYAGEVYSDDLEEHELLRLSRDEVETMLDGGEVQALPWVAVITLALRALDRNGTGQNE